MHKNLYELQYFLNYHPVVGWLVGLGPIRELPLRKIGTVKIKKNKLMRNSDGYLKVLYFSSYPFPSVLVRLINLSHELKKVFT